MAHYTTRVAARRELLEELSRILAPRKLAFELVAHTMHIELALSFKKVQMPSNIEIYYQRMGALAARKLGFKPVLDKRADHILTLEMIHLSVVCRTCQAHLYFENGHSCFPLSAKANHDFLNVQREAFAMNIGSCSPLVLPAGTCRSTLGLDRSQT